MENKKNIFFKNFICKIIEKDLFEKKVKKIHTRFAPEPNGYLHIGHAKSIVLNFGIAEQYNGKCNLRFDDTNPEKENLKYIKNIKKDIQWLGFQWYKNIHYTSDYFDQLYNYAILLIKKGLAYVDNLNQEEIRKFRGTLNVPGLDSPYRSRTIKENIFLFEKMKNGDFKEGQASLRAKINMQDSTILMRDPVLYRIKFKKHHQTNNTWCIYPMYDFAHCISDALEGITHSFCTLEFLDNKKLYNWILKNIDIKSQPTQYEFSRLNIEYNVISKRKLDYLVKNKIVKGWDDPRLLTISGLRKRGYTASAIKDFCYKVGITKQENIIEMSSLEFCIRNTLNKNAFRIMGVLEPIKIILKNLPNNYEEILFLPNHPNLPNMGKREVPFSNEIYIERSDFREKKHFQYKRLILGGKVRLRYAYVIKAEYIKKNIKGEIISIFCKCYPKTFEEKNLGIIHWVSALHAIPAKFYLYKNLFKIKNPEKIKDFYNFINNKSLLIKNGFLEPSIKNSKNSHYQLERKGYFYIENLDFKKNLIFNCTAKLFKK